MRKIVIGVLILMLTASIGATTIGPVKGSPKLFQALAYDTISGSGTLGTGTVNLAQIYSWQITPLGPTFVAGSAAAIFIPRIGQEVVVVFTIKTITFRSDGCEVSLIDAKSGTNIALESILGNCAPTSTVTDAVDAFIWFAAANPVNPLFSGTGKVTIFPLTT